MNVLIVINDAPYSTERPFNALRLAAALAEDPDTAVNLFLIGDGAWCAVPRPKPEEAAYDMEWMLRRYLAGGRRAAVCRTCMEARGIADGQLIEGACRSTLAELAQFTRAADKVFTF